MTLIKFLVTLCAILLVEQSVFAKTVTLPTVDISNITINGKKITDTQIDGVDINATCAVSTGWLGSLNPMGNKTKPCNFDVEHSTEKIWFDGHTVKGFKIPQINLSYADKKDINLCVNIAFLKNTDPESGYAKYNNTIMRIAFCNNATEEDKEDFIFPLSQYKKTMESGIF